MGLKALSKVRKDGAAEFTADLSEFSEDGELSITFRRPKAPDYFIPSDLRKKLLISFPELANADPTLPAMILTMGACYVPDKDEQGVEPWRALAQMSRDCPMAILSLITQFGEAFPSSISEAKTDAKNDLAQ
jgi:hypothetical protein